MCGNTVIPTMTDIWTTLATFARQHEAQLMTWAMPVVLLALAALLGLPMLRRWQEERALLRRIRRLGVASLHNVVIPDGIGGTVFLEHVVLHPEGILVLPVRRYRGAVFAADKIDTWTQVLGKRSYKFPNPLRELESVLLAVRNLAPEAKVAGYLLVTREATFPKGKPEAIVSFSEARERWGKSRKGTLSSVLQEAWHNLQDNAQPLDRKLQQEVLEPEPAARSNLLIAGLMVLAALAWLGWRLNP